jgi:hypothetical protein
MYVLRAFFSTHANPDSFSCFTLFSSTSIFFSKAFQQEELVVLDGPRDEFGLFVATGYAHTTE